MAHGKGILSKRDLTCQVQWGVTVNFAVCNAYRYIRNPPMSRVNAICSMQSTYQLKTYSDLEQWGL
jgi:hypothetical protein